MKQVSETDVQEYIREYSWRGDLYRCYASKFGPERAMERVAEALRKERNQMT